MPLTEPQKVTVAEITRETYADVNTGSADLTAEQVTSIQADVVTWNLIRDKHLRVKGGKDGIDLDNEREREAIRQRVRKQFGWSLISDEALELSGDTMQMIEIDTGVSSLYG